jgi:uracil-DNA glycosylase
MPGSDDLAQYLKQLRELGESRLTFDNLSAADALRGMRRTGLVEPPPRSAAPVEEKRGTPARDESAVGIGDPIDWRAALRAADAEHPSPSSPPKNAPAIRTSASSGVVPPVPRYSLPEPREEREGSAKSPAVAPAPGLDVRAAASDIFSAAGAFDSIEAVAAAVAGCRRCPVHSGARNPVPGEGNTSAELVCVGEGPGASEDETGRPFVGAAGKLLTSILGAIKLAREDVFICNVVKHRPPGNRTPLPDEVSACQPYLARQLELIRPKVILALGAVAAQTLLGTKLSLGKLRGAVHRYDGIPLIVTYHPAALLRNPAWKRPTWEDVQHVRRILDGAGRT